MDRYIDGPQYLPAYDLLNPCAQDKNFAVAPDAAVALYHGYASQGALADAYFQPVVGQTSSNDMFLATAQFEFLDNDWFPDRVGADCQMSQSSDPLASKPEKHVITGRKTIADLLLEKDPQKGFGYYHVGYQQMLDATSSGQLDKHNCPLDRAAECPHYLLTSLPCFYDPSDDPFKYYDQFGDDSPYIHDYTELAKDLERGALPSVVYVKAAMYLNEHPGYAYLSQGEAFVKSTVDLVLGSRYRDDTLVLVTWDEGGGLYDHVSPPVASDGRRMGTRVPLLALGPYARKGWVSHVVMEHSSIVKFLEWNFLGGKVGQLGGREASVKNIGSMLDPALGVPDGDDG
jgi:phospholipase C